MDKKRFKQKYRTSQNAGYPSDDQHDRSKTGPTNKLSISLRATWTSVDPCSQLIKLERRGKK